MVIAKRIKEERIKKGMTQEVLGKLIGVSKTTISYYETGKEQPKMDRLRKLIEVLEITPNYIFGSDIDVILEENEEYSIKISKFDLEILNNLKQHPTLYKKLCDEPKRTIELIELKLNK